MTWHPPPIDEAAATAVAALEEPSRPQPLAGSHRTGERSWRIELTPTEVRQAYQAADAPVPSGSTVTVDPLGSVVIRAPFSSTIVLFDNCPTGSAYSLVPGPTLRIQSTSGKLPVGEYFVACGVDTVDLSTGEPALTAAAAFVQGGQHWLFGLTRPDGGSGTAPPGYVAVLASYDPTDPSSYAGLATGTPCEASEQDGVVTATFSQARDKVTVIASRTTSATSLLSSIVPTPPKLDPALRVGCVSKLASGPMDQRITGIGGMKDGKPWRLATDELLTRVRAGERFYVQQDPNDEAVLVQVATGTSGHDYPLAKSGRVNLLIGLPKCRKVRNPLPGP